MRKATASLALLLLIANLPSAEAGVADHVVINEVFYDPPAGWPEPEAEWVELYNPTSSPVDLSGWRLTDDPDPGGGNEGAYEFPPGAAIEAGSYLIVAYSGLEFFARYGFYPDYELEDSTPDVPDMIQVRYTISLANTCLLYTSPSPRDRG